MDSQGKDFLPCAGERFIQRLKEADFPGGKLQCEIGAVVETAGEFSWFIKRRCHGRFRNPSGSAGVVVFVREELPVFPVRIEKTFFSILGVTYYLTLDVFTDTLKQMAELSALGSAVVFDYPIKTGEFPRRVERLEQITEGMGEVMRGGYDYNEVSRALYSLGFQIDTYMPPEKVQVKYFSGRSDNMRAFENVSLISASYTSGYDYE